MQIPEPLHSYDKSTLLVVADSEHAKPFLLKDREITPLEEISIDFPPKDNEDRREADTMTPGGIHSAHTEEKLDTEKVRRFSQMLANMLQTLLQDGVYEELILTVPHEHVNEFVETLHNDVRARLIMTIPKLLTKEPLLEILERVQKEA